MKINPTQLFDPDAVSRLLSEKISRKKQWKERQAMQDTADEKYLPGYVWLVPDEKVTFSDQKKGQFVHDNERPGVVLETKIQQHKSQIGWIPFSSQLKHRNPSITVFLDPATECVKVECVALVTHLLWFLPVTLQLKIGSLSTGKFAEIRDKYAHWRSHDH